MMPNSYPNKIPSDYILEDLVNSAGRPEILFLDMRPVSYGMMVVTSHEVAEQISKATKMYPYSVTKSPTLRGFVRLIGKQSLLSEEVRFSFSFFSNSFPHKLLSEDIVLPPQHAINVLRG